MRHTIARPRPTPPTLCVYIVPLLSLDQSVTNHEDNIRFPPDCPHGLHRGEIHQTRIKKFSEKPRRPETEKISFWHRAKEKDGENCQWERYQDLPQTKPEGKTHENAH